jgi:hypothetical protein
MPSQTDEVPAEVSELRSSAAVRERCNMIARWVAAGNSPYFSLDAGRLGAAADYVAQVTRETYPHLNIPYHSRWRHFCAGGIDRWNKLADTVRVHPLERARMATDLVTVSVLLDAGAGNAWRYRDPESGISFSRSEGLAIASLEMFRAGAFSSARDRPCQVDELALRRIKPETLGRYFQVSDANPLLGLQGRCTLIGRLADALAARGDLFGRGPARPGNLVDYFVSGVDDHTVAAPLVLRTLLDAFASIWPSGLKLGDVPIGDAGRHDAVRTGDATEGIVPFHKLSQWLTYSLIEPLGAAELTVERIEELTALAEYRNGGLLIDLGAIKLSPRVHAQLPREVQSELIVEWRALTVALMDQLLPLVRDRLGLASSRFTLPHLLQGGTWSAGRRIAQTLRPPDGPPPLAVIADGTVF